VGNVVFIPFTLESNVSPFILGSAFAMTINKFWVNLSTTYIAVSRVWHEDGTSSIGFACGLWPDGLLKTRFSLGLAQVM